MDEDALISLTPELETMQRELSVDDTLSLDLAISDDDFLAIVKDKTERWQQGFDSKYKLKERWKKNENYWKGDQHEGKIYEPHQTRYTNNVIHRDLETRIAVAAGRMPDIIVIPENPLDKGSTDDAKEYEEFLNAKINPDTTKRLMKNVLRDHQMKLTGCVKPVWDPNVGEKGDIRFERVKPANLILDIDATIPEDGFSADNMSFVSEFITEPLSLIIAKFPSAKEALMRKFKVKDTSSSAQMIQSVRYRETWFSWYSSEGEPIEGTAWHYQDIVFKKQKSAYWDWTEENNHFDLPRKPYIFASYENLGYSPYDDTSVLEQSLDLQDIINKRGEQITEINDRSTPKVVVAGSTMTKAQAETITDDPKETIYLDGDVPDASKAITTIQGPVPGPGLYADLQNNVTQIDAHFATHQISRSEDDSDASGISKQINREGDLTIADDVVEIIVQRMVMEMANWATQLIRLYYYDPNAGLDPKDPEDAKSMDYNFTPWSIKRPGKNGNYQQASITREAIKDGISVIINSNTIDKPTRRSMAMQLAQMKALDPYTLYEWLDLPNPRELAVRLIAFLNMGGPNGAGPAQYLQQIGVSMDDLQAATAGGMPSQDPDPKDDQQQALQDIQNVMQGEAPSLQGQPSDTYVSTFKAFLMSKKFDELPEQAQEALLKFQDTLTAAAQAPGMQPAVGAPSPDNAPPPQGMPLGAGQPGQPPVDAGGAPPVQ